MNANTMRQRFLNFFRQRAHAVVGYAPLIPENDPSVLFTTAGMHPLAPFLLGQPHPAGRRLANYQKCLRTNDILEVGDASHLTFFEMLGNWSLGDYWKEEAILLNYSLLTEAFGHDPARLHITCFAGDADAPRDIESAEVWAALGIPASRITFLPKSDNWWGPVGVTGPCGPDSEVFYDMAPLGEPGATPATHPHRFVELSNNVFLAYERRTDGSYIPLGQRNIDVGVGLERNLMVIQGVDSVFATDLFAPIIEAIHMRAGAPQVFPVRIIADHVRAAVLILAEGIRPGNTDQPYIARRLIRRAIRYGREIKLSGSFLAQLAATVIDTLAGAYPELAHHQADICAALDEEERRFQQTLVRGEREFTRVVSACKEQGQPVLPGSSAFQLYETFGFPLELVEELAQQQGLQVDRSGYERAFAAHQEQSRVAAAGRFPGRPQRAQSANDEAAHGYAFAPGGAAPGAGVARQAAGQQYHVRATAL
jgi:alanyl-tRNA synthetase